jgi:endonuclease/exonuclease/phosphatase family metal-dependent hydrolase
LRKYVKKILIWVNLLCIAALFGSYISVQVNPEYLWQFAFFGLAYPILFLLNAAFFIFWLINKKWLAVLSLAAILIGWADIGKYFQLGMLNRDVEVSESSSILSFNVRLFNYYGWEENKTVRNQIMDFLIEEHSDLICIQEFLTVANKRGDSEESINKALDFLPYRHIFYTYKPNEFSNYGLATYSKYPMIKKGSIRFKNSYNACIITDLLIDGDTVRVFNVHLQSIKFKKVNYDAMDSLTQKLNARRIEDVKDISARLKLAYIKRAEQVDELKWHIKQSPYPVIICGDFNDTPISYSYHQVRGDLEDAFVGSGSGIGNTYRGKLPSFRIDFIFYSPLYSSRKYHTHRLSLSDHYPVSCEIYKKPL